MQMTGTLLSPAISPLAAFNGRTSYTCRLVADGRGNVTGSCMGISMDWSSVLS